MIKFILILTFCFFWFSYNAFAQDDEMAIPVYKSNNMIAIRNITTNLSKDEISNCAIKKYTGNILSIKEGYPLVTAMIRTPKFKEYIMISTENMSNADRSNFFYSLLKRGNRVMIDAYMCGSGGFLYGFGVKSVTIRK